MDRVAMFVDAGYLLAQGSVALSGRKHPRGNLLLDHVRTMDTLETLAGQLSGLPLLRIYWYDGTSTGPTSQHLALAHQPRVKVRLGFVNSQGEQKGVDSLIVTDMITLARNRAMADAVLISGDEDLRVGVQQAQELGVRVHVVGIRPSRGSQSLFLLQEADSTLELSASDLAPFLRIRQPELASRVSAAVSHDRTLEAVARELAAEIPSPELHALALMIREQGHLPREVDGRLLARSRTRLGSRLDVTQKRLVREAFLKMCEGLVRDEDQPG